MRYLHRVLAPLAAAALLAGPAHAVTATTQIIDGVPQVIVPQQLIVSCNPTAALSLCTSALDRVGAVVQPSSAWETSGWRSCQATPRCKASSTCCGRRWASPPPSLTGSSSAALPIRRLGSSLPPARRAMRRSCPARRIQWSPCSTAASRTRTTATCAARTCGRPSSPPRSSPRAGTSSTTTRIPTTTTATGPRWPASSPAGGASPPPQSPSSGRPPERPSCR